MDTLHKLLRKLELGQIGPAALLVDEKVIPELLDERDEEAFSSRWMEAYRNLEAMKASQGVDENIQTITTRIREAAYLRAYERWQPPDLAAYISDDFGLIADALTANVNEPWIKGLLRAYATGRFPVGALEEPTGNLAEEIG